MSQHAYERQDTPWGISKSPHVTGGGAAPVAYRDLMRPIRLLAAGLAAAAVTLPAWMPGSAMAAPTVVAKGSWVMVPMSKDANGDGFIDGDGGVPTSGALSLTPARTYQGAGNGIAQPNERLINGAVSWYLDPAGYPVRLNACASSGDRYRWRITRRSDGAAVLTTPERALGKKTCTSQVTLPEGAYDFELTVRGHGRASTTIPARVRNILMVAMGDSYASGEGNPRNVEAWLRDGGAFIPFNPYWDDDRCRRSTRGGPAQAALMLEQASSTTSVTLVDVACSGATVDAGVLGPQPNAGQALSQLEQVRRIVGNRALDLVTISIGGNDVGFTNILASCATVSDCPIQPASSGSLAKYPTLQQGVQAQTAELPGDYARIAACLGGASCALVGNRGVPPLVMADDAAVLPTLYPDITRSASGQPCSYLTLSPSDFAWARDTILDPNPAGSYDYRSGSGSATSLSLAAGTLNQQVGGTFTLGWHPVTKIWAVTGQSAAGHGVCAGNDAWVFGLTTLQGFSSAGFHPNPQGQQAIGEAIAGAARHNLFP